ncbi:MAG: type II toxin-antitoxin system VapC family toxin [Spirochaetota bacterium]
MAAVVVETSFLIDLEREQRADASGPAHAFLERRVEARLYITQTIAGEMACGVATSGLARLERLLQPFGVLAITRAVAFEYGRIYRYLSTNGLLIGANDLWIAAAARVYECAIVTADTDHYARVPDLEVLGYQ